MPPHDASADGLRGPRHEVVPASANETPADLSISDVEGAACTAEPHRHGAIAYPGPPQEYFEIDYLFWGLEGARVPTLLTSNPTGTALRDVGNPAAASTTTLLGNQSLGDWGQSGVRLRWGKRLQDSVVDRLEMSLWMLFEREDDLNFASNGGDPMLARPFTNSVSGLPDAQVISMAGVADGSFNSNYSRQLYGIDPLAFFCVHGNACESLDVFSGYRYFHYEDRLDLTERVMLEPGGVVAPGTELLVEDQFEAHNDYHLLPLGVNYARR
ncbi:MAG: BBP7 family outer membrane beta-barrel protein, partial [Planctomycetales bacterium]|nr:BBP7 family outer membrane beta-barrel protein [Planctomycetales bacterium]